MLLPRQAASVRAASLAVATLASVVLGACSKTDGASATPATASSRASGSDQPAASGNASPVGGQTGAQGGRSAFIALAATDVVTIRRDTLEEGTAITGDLLPIEQIDVRARLEGDLTGVYVREGERVRRGQVLARFEASEQVSGRASAAADRAAAETELATTQWDVEQSRELFKAGAIAERDLRNAEQQVAVARARLAAADARVRSSASLVQDTRVLAPTTGVIAARLVEAGEHVARNAVLFTVVRGDILELEAAVPSRFASGIVAGQAVHFTADGRDVDGRVARVSPTVDPATRSVKVFVQIPNASSALKGGTFASGRIVARVLPNVLVVPTAALRQAQDDGRPFVYRITDRTLEHAPVRLGVVDEASGRAEVLDGLREGDRVVVGNVGALGRGMKVDIMGTEGPSPSGQAPSPGSPFPRPR